MSKPQVFTLGKTSTAEIEKIMNDSPQVGAIIRAWLEAKLGDDVLQQKFGQVVLEVKVLVHDIQEEKIPENDVAVN